jgi:hypothetical protein
MSPVAKDLISQLLTLSTADRLGARGVSEIQAHPFFEGIDWEHLAEATAPFLPPWDDPTSTKYFDGRNNVFQSPLEVNLTGDRLEDITLGVCFLGHPFSHSTYLVHAGVGFC